MCGIAGSWSVDSKDVASLTSRVKAMAAAIRHRGPDDEAVWASANDLVVFAHQRLAIQDLSELGRQPMESVSGRYVIVFNGEIYNFKRLRAELSQNGIAFRGHSDTEVMLAAFELWGVEASLDRFNGMFAFAVYDNVCDELWLARDRMGEKPLYYAFVDERLLFCSELKGMLAGIGKRLRLNWKALGSYFRYGYLPVDESPFESIRKLPPASFVRLTRSDLLRLEDAISISNVEKRYWYRTDMAPSSNFGSYDGTNAGDRLEELLSASVLDQAVADVPVGVFLSGGVDSSVVAALLQQNSTHGVNTYTIAFDSPEYNEAPFAQDIARHLGTNHCEIPVAIDECLDVIQRLPELLDEPFADASLLPTFIVCREARKHVTVCLSGDGGDELFGGYNRYVHGARLADLRNRLPLALRGVIGGGLDSISEQSIDAIYKPFAHVMRLLARKPEKDIGNKVHKLARALKANTEREMYAGLLSFWLRSPLAKPGGFPALVECLLEDYPGDESFSVAAMSCDIGFYLVCDNLFKVDRAAMANSLEVRLPLLDRSVVEFASQLPLDCKIKAGSSKTILREVLYRYVPSSLIERPKMGFSVPVGSWLRGGLQEWARSFLDDSDSLSSLGLEPRLIQGAWSEHLNGYKDNANALWAILMYQQWRSAYAEYILD